MREADYEMAIATRHLIVHDKDLRTLEADVWSNAFVPAYLLNQNVHTPIQLRYRGGHTRVYSKRSFEIVKGNTTFHLNAEYDDPSMLRNALSFQFFEWIGAAAPLTNHCHLLLNGKSLGVYLEIEAVDHHFFARRHIPVLSLFYAVKGNADFGLYNPLNGIRKEPLYKGYTVQFGDDTDSDKLGTFIYKLNTLSDKRLYAFIASKLDLNNYVRWLAGVVFTGNYDGFDHNYALYEHGIRKIYRIIPWDYEGTWGRNCFGQKIKSDLVRVTGYNKLTKRLLSFRHFRNMYKRILKDILVNTFTVDKIIPVVERMHDSIAPYMYRDSERKWSTSQFDEEPEVIRQYILERKRIIANALGKL
jgi:spore coat protein H